MGEREERQQQRLPLLLSRRLSEEPREALSLPEVRSLLSLQGQHDQALEARVRPAAALPVPVLQVPQQADVQRDVAHQDQAPRSGGLRGEPQARERGVGGVVSRRWWRVASSRGGPYGREGGIVAPLVARIRARTLGNVPNLPQISEVTARDASEFVGARACQSQRRRPCSGIIVFGIIRHNLRRALSLLVRLSVEAPSAQRRGETCVSRCGCSCSRKFLTLGSACVPPPPRRVMR